MVDEKVLKYIWEFLEEEELSIDTLTLTQLLSIFRLQPYNAMSYMLPIRELALYIIDRIYLLPLLSPLLVHRTKMMIALRSHFPDLPELPTYPELDRLLDNALGSMHRIPGYKQQIPALMDSVTVFMHFFLQLANPVRRLAELTYTFIYERTAKIELLLKMVGRSNFIITKEIEGTEYIQLVFDTVRRENLLLQLPYQYMKPKIAMVIAEDPILSDFKIPEFQPEYLMVVGNNDSVLSGKGERSAYFMKYNDRNFTYRFETSNHLPIELKEFNY